MILGILGMLRALVMFGILHVFCAKQFFSRNVGNCAPEVESRTLGADLVLHLMEPQTRVRVEEDVGNKTGR